MSIVTMQDHLLGVHVGCAHALAVASREELGPAHPLRALMTRYTFGTIAINAQATNTLLTSRNTLHRVTPFADYQNALRTAMSTPVSLDAVIEVLNSPDSLLQESPFVSDGLNNFELNQYMVEQFFDQYGWCQGDVFTDSDVERFAQKVGSIVTTALLDVNTNSCEGFKTDLVKLAFAVSGLHSHCGNVLEVLGDPDIAGTSWFEGDARAAPVQFMLLASLNHLTNHHHNPTMDQDFGHLCNDDKCRDIFDVFKGKADDVSHIIEQRNTARKVLVNQEEYNFPYVAFDPKYCENSVTK